MVTKTLVERRQEFEEWVRTVRVPATKLSEGIRRLEVKNGRATAEYEIAQIAGETWAIRINLAYHCGDHRGLGLPWATFPDRDQCLTHFLQTARRHFRLPREGFLSDAQLFAQKEMSELLRDGLFGFSEPAPIVRV